MYRLSSILLTVIFLYSLSFKSILTFNFFVNQIEITELFCINKEKPQLQCNGKCHLTKQFIKAENNKDEMPFSQNNSEEILKLELNFIGNNDDLNNFFDNTWNKGFIFFNEDLSIGFKSIKSPPPESC